ncbi:MAG: efflux RND transporter permease subunit [Planctomycetota bacterium]|nr:efflux RND transporter permease subunit [Planctomycetota bacterium]
MDSAPQDAARPPGSSPGPEDRATTGGWASWLVSLFIDSKLTPLAILASLLLGTAAVVMLPREEEPQIVVPMIDIFVEMPAASAREVEQRVTRPLEKLLWEIPGVEYLYSTSSAGRALVIVRFEVGHSASDAIVKLNAKIANNMDRIPPTVSQPLIKVRSIDDVPILALTLWSDRYGPGELRRIAAQLTDCIKQPEGVAETDIIGGLKRTVRVIPDRTALAARGLSLLDLAGALRQANQPLTAGSFSSGDREALVETGAFLADAGAVGAVVVGTYGGRPVKVADVAQVEDGPDEPKQYVFFRPGPAAATHEGGLPLKAQWTEPAKEPLSAFRPAVTISIAKRRGTSAIDVAEQVLRKVEDARGTLVPDGVNISITRHYGKTAAEKANELLFHMGIAVVSVALLIALMLGWREAGVVAIAIPVTLALTLAAFYCLGFTLNRITLFALIFSIGILVDDPIVDVENIVRHMRLASSQGKPVVRIVREAVNEVRSPLILATLTVMAAILPMAFVRGLMGPYMRPIPIGAGSAMLFSMIVAFVATPWAAARVLKGRLTHPGAGHGAGEKEDFMTRLYRHVMGFLIHHRLAQYLFLLFLVALLLGALYTVPSGWVKVKMLPFDNKSEFQVIIDMPEDTTLERTTDVARRLAAIVARRPEVRDIQVYAGTAAPYNFNGLVRHYYLRGAPYQADLQVNLVPKEERKLQSHAIAKAVREELVPAALAGKARIKVAEVPPGPPVLQTLVAEVYGEDDAARNEWARKVLAVFRATPGVVDADIYLETDQAKFRFDIDREKAALHGVDTATISQNLRMAVGGEALGIIHYPREREDVDLVVRPSRADRSPIGQLNLLPVRTRDGGLVPLGELTTIREVLADTSIYHKNLIPVTSVTADVAGAAESPAYALLNMRAALEKLNPNPGPHGNDAVAPGFDMYLAHQPFSSGRFAIKWDGELHITYEVFRDLGLAFAAVLVLIYVLIVGWFESFKTPFVIMAAIPFSLVGILPAHGAVGAFFSATSMIGFIAGAGIVVRNSIILVDFIELRLREGMPLAEAVIDAGAVRFRPMLLTALAVVVGASVILFDPIFQGLALSLMAGEVASLLLSRMAVPVLYYLAQRPRGGAVGSASRG